MRETAARVHGAFALVMTLLVTLYLVTDGVPRRLVVVLASALPAVVIARQVVRGRVPRANAWWTVVAGLVALTAHNVVSLAQLGLMGRPVATGPLPMVTLPLGYLLLLVASALLAFPFARRDVGGVIDGVVIAVGCLSVFWAVIVQPVLVARGADGGELAYTLFVLLLLSSITGAVVRALVVSPAARPVLLYLFVAIATTLAGNILSELLRDPGTRVTPWWIGFIWIIGYLAVGAAAAHPAVSHLGDPEVLRDSSRLTGTRVVVLGTVLGLNPLLAAFTGIRGGDVDWVLLSAGTLALVPLVLTRIWQLAALHTRAEQELRRLAHYDELTGLPNRRTLDQHLDAVLRSVADGESPGAVVCFLDLDDFKDVNDRHGHSVGDALLVAVARRVTGALRSDDLVARFGGDELVVVSEGDPEVVEARVASAVAAVCTDPVVLGDVSVTCRISLGAARVPRGTRVAREEVLARADAAMYQVKGRRDAERSTAR